MRGGVLCMPVEASLKSGRRRPPAAAPPAEGGGGVVARARRPRATKAVARRRRRSSLRSRKSPGPPGRVERRHQPVVHPLCGHRARGRGRRARGGAGERAARLPAVEEQEEDDGGDEPEVEEVEVDDDDDEVEEVDDVQYGQGYEFAARPTRSSSRELAPGGAVVRAAIATPSLAAARRRAAPPVAAAATPPAAAPRGVRRRARRPWRPRRGRGRGRGRQRAWQARGGRERRRVARPAAAVPVEELGRRAAATGRSRRRWCGGARRCCSTSTPTTRSFWVLDQASAAGSSRRSRARRRPRRRRRRLRAVRPAFSPRCRRRPTSTSRSRSLSSLDELRQARAGARAAAAWRRRFISGNPQPHRECALRRCCARRRRAAAVACPPSAPTARHRPSRRLDREADRADGLLRERLARSLRSRDGDGAADPLGGSRRDHFGDARRPAARAPRRRPRSMVPCSMSTLPSLTLLTANGCTPRVSQAALNGCRRSRACAGSCECFQRHRG